MTIDIVKCIVFAIAVSILYGVIGHLNRKKIAISGKIQSDAQYIVTLPSALKYVYMAMFLLGIALFFIASAIGFTSGNESSMAIVWLCLGSSFLCLGSTHKKKENNTDDK